MNSGLSKFSPSLEKHSTRMTDRQALHPYLISKMQSFLPSITWHKGALGGWKILLSLVISFVSFSTFNRENRCVYWLIDDGLLQGAIISYMYRHWGRTQFCRIVLLCNVKCAPLKQIQHGTYSTQFPSLLFRIRVCNVYTYAIIVI
jgi:hypothetical protein